MPELSPFTVAGLAQHWGCRDETVLGHIHERRLDAFSIGKPGARRPSWRITVAAVERFERGEQPAPKPKPRRRLRKANPDFVEFF